MVSLVDYNVSARMKAVMEQVAQTVVERLYPTPRYATVTAFNTATRTVTVRYPDEPSTTFTIPCGTNMPSVIGSTVRVVGRQGARYVDEIIDGKVSLTVARFTDVTEASLASTGHAFQIGPSTGLNLIADADEIQARNNGAASSLLLNPHGGNVVVGDGSTGSILVIGNDASLRDVNVAHVVALVSQSNTAVGALRLGLAGPQINTDGTYIHLDSNGDMYYDGTVHRFRPANGSFEVAQIYDINGTGHGGIIFSGGGGWYMADSTWIRSVNNKAVYTSGEIRGGKFSFEGSGYVINHGSDTDTGMYYDGDGTFRLIANGGTACYITTNILTVPTGSILRLRATTDANHELKHTTSTPSGSGEAADGPILKGFSSVWLHCVNGDKNLYLASSGNVFINGGQSYGNFSSRRIKKNIQALVPNACLEQVLRWRPVEFDVIETDVHKTGFIAEEMVDVSPSAVIIDGPESKYAGLPVAIAYGELTVQLAGAVQALHEEIQELKAQLAEQRNNGS